MRRIRKTTPTLSYRGYTGFLEVDLDASELFGRTVGTRDIITFHGKTVDEARKSFEESVDFYLSCCLDEGKEPDRPYSGRFNIRISPEVHRCLAILAQSRGQSLNEVVSAALAVAVGAAPERSKTPEPSWQEVKAGLEARRPRMKQSEDGHHRPRALKSARPSRGKRQTRHADRD